MTALPRGPDFHSVALGIYINDLFIFDPINQLLFEYLVFIIIIIILHLVMHPTKCYINSKVRAPSEKTNSE